MTPQEIAEINKLIEPGLWQRRLKTIYSAYLWHELSDPHCALWDWAVSESSSPFVALWPRARGKSTHAEIFAADMGARNINNYCMYISGTQDQADKHVQTIARMLESKEMATCYPAVGTPRIGKNGGRTWNRRIVVTSNNYTVEAVGLNKAVRGHKIDWARPDLFIFDDIDERHDTENATKKKREIITSSILPAGTPDCRVLFCQNILKSGSIAHELSIPVVDGGANYLTDRIISGPYPAVEGLDYELQDGKWAITKGESLWGGFTIEDCEQEINRVGPTSYEAESQHNIQADNPNALLTADIFDATRVTFAPDMDIVAVGVDPSGGAGQCGIVAAGVAMVAKEWHGFTLDDNSTDYGTTADKWGEAALWCYYNNNADYFVVEKNFGGDMASNTIKQAVIYDDDGEELLSGKNVKIVMVSASRGKKVRAQPVAALFQRGIIHHVGYYPKLEGEWTSWEPGEPSPDRLDAEVWAYSRILLKGKPKTASSWQGY